MSAELAGEIVATIVLSAVFLGYGFWAVLWSIVGIDQLKTGHPNFKHSESAWLAAIAGPISILCIGLLYYAFLGIGPVSWFTNGAGGW